MPSKKSRQITLAKALKLKSRLVGKISAVEMTIRTYNSVEDGAEKFDTANAFSLHQELKGYLIDLKDKINAANRPIQRLIYELSELKADLSFLTSVPTRQGIFSQGYGSDEKVTYVAKVSKQELDERSATLQARIDELQDSLDEHNGRTTIEVEDSMLTQATAALPKKWYE